MKSEVLSIMKERDFYNAKVEEQKKYMQGKHREHNM